MKCKVICPRSQLAILEVMRSKAFFLIGDLKAVSSLKILRTSLPVVLLLSSPFVADIQAQLPTGAPKPVATSDTITLTDGEQLIGKLVKVLAGTVTFHSSILGDVSIPIAKVKTLHAANFAVINKDQHLTEKTAAKTVPVGFVSIDNNTVAVFRPALEPETFPATNLGSMIEARTFEREIQGEHQILYGWTGSATVGASLVEGTNSNQTYTGGVAFVRNIPSTTWLPPHSKTSLNLSGTYGLAKNSQIVSGGTILQTASTSKTDILHGDTEYDRYFSPAIFGVASASADHNYGNGVELQQAYGGGIGWTVRSNPKNTLNLKAQLQYEQQQFYNGLTSGLGTPNENLVGLALNETWLRTYTHNIKFNESLTLNPTFNFVQAYSTTGTAGVLFPVYKRLNFTLNSSDTYLGDPPEGYLRNSFQFTAGATYTIK